MSDITEWPQPWFKDLHGVHDLCGHYPLTDDDIDKAVPFDGHHEEYLKWPDELWKDRANGNPCRDNEKNAYHVRHLAEAMIDNKLKWIGHGHDNFIMIHPCGKISEGNHRIRAVRYLYDRKRLLVHEPEKIRIIVRKSYPDRPNNYEYVFALRPIADRVAVRSLVEKIPQNILEGPVEWFSTKHLDLNGKNPKQCLDSGEFDLIARLFN